MLHQTETYEIKFVGLIQELWKAKIYHTHIYIHTPTYINQIYLHINTYTILYKLCELCMYT